MLLEHMSHYGNSCHRLRIRCRNKTNASNCGCGKKRRNGSDIREGGFRVELRSE